MGIEGFSPRLKRPGHDADHSPPASAKVKNGGAITPLPHKSTMAWSFINWEQGQYGGMRYRSWLRHYATSRKVEGSIPDEVTGFFNRPNPFSCTTALGSTQRNECQGSSLEVKSGRRLRLTSVYCLEKMWEHRRLTTLWASTAPYRDSFSSCLPLQGKCNITLHCWFSCLFFICFILLCWDLSLFPLYFIGEESFNVLNNSSD
jgi:hypothetical protein